MNTAAKTEEGKMNKTTEEVKDFIESCDTLELRIIKLWCEQLITKKEVEA
jgi:hypothetical protein